MNQRTDRFIAFGLAAAYAGQGILIVRHQQPVPAALYPFLMGAAALALLAALAWLERRWLNSHADMLILMGGFGGLGMFLGAEIDGGAACHAGALRFVSWMTAGMLAGGFLPALAWSRCARQARERGQLLRVVAFDFAGMWLGMFSSAALLSLLPVRPSLGLWAHPLLVAGMLAGMAVSMALRPGWLRFLNALCLHPRKLAWPL